MGHARALLTIDKPALQLKLYNLILKDGLSVRRVEELAKKMQSEKDDEQKQAPASRYSSNDFDILKKHLSSTFKTSVQFSCNNDGKGKISFPFKNEEELERLITIFDKLKQSEAQ
jgi:ParB family chromosome partitioning protein